MKLGGPAAILVLVIGIGAAATAAVTGHRAAHSASGPAEASSVAVSTATVTRHNLSATEKVDGQLAYAPTPEPVTVRIPGTYTMLPAEGAIVTEGQALFAVDNEPVVLFVGALPAWRPFQSGMSDGTDVAELEANLQWLGFAHGFYSAANDHFDAATASAIRRWQESIGANPTGSIDLGRIAFMPGSVRVGAHSASLGTEAAPGSPPYIATSATRVATIALDATQQGLVHIGAAVTIDRLDGTTLPGTVTDIGHAATASPSSDQSGQNGAGNGPPTIQVTVTPLRPEPTGTLDTEPVRITLTTALRSHVLTVPITALLARAGGGFGVEVVEPTGVHRIVATTPGLYSDTEVEVTGRDIHAGTTVVVAQ